jgi:cytochrome c5
MKACRRRNRAGDFVNHCVASWLPRILAVAVLAAAIARPAMAADAASPGEGVINRVCSRCHSIQVVRDTPKDFDAWHDTVQKMIDHGAQGTPEDFEAIMQYLFANLTTIDVNHCDMDELTTVLHASQADAQAIVDRRKAHSFKNLAELEAAVPGLDKALLDGKKKMLFFQ